MHLYTESGCIAEKVKMKAIEKAKVERYQPRELQNQHLMPSEDGSYAEKRRR